MCGAPSELRCVLCTNRLSPVLPALIEATGVCLAGLAHPTNPPESVEDLRRNAPTCLPMCEYIPGKPDAFLDFLQQVRAQLLVVYGFQHIIPEKVLAHFPGVNLHPSLLPAFPGLNPWQEQMQAGVSAGGYTVHMLSPQPDAGRILAQAEFPWPAPPTDLQQLRRETLLQFGIPLLIKTLRHYNITK